MKSEFDGYVVVGDRVSRQYPDGWELVAYLVADEDTRPTDFDCYEPEDIELWEQGEWSYMGLVIAVYRHGVMLDPYAASVWGVDCNFPVPINSTYSTSEHLSELFDEMEEEALQRGRDILKILVNGKEE
jgi:hypothetical protein